MNEEQGKFLEELYHANFKRMLLELYPILKDMREQARQKRTFLPLEVLLPESEPSEWDDSDRELVQLCLDVVSEEDFTLFRRVTLDGWAYVDAAKAAGISLWACYKRVERTQKKLRRAIEEHPERFF